MLVMLRFRVDGQDVGETKSGAVPEVGQQVTLEHGLRGRRRYRVVDVNHQYTDSGIRRVDVFAPAPILVDLEEET